MLKLFREAELLEYHQVFNRASFCLYCLKYGVLCCLILKLLVCLAHNNIVDLMHAVFIHVFLPRFQSYVLLFKVGNICLRLGTIHARFRYECWHTWVREVLQCLGHDVWLVSIDVGLLKIPLQLRHHTGKFFRGYWSNIEDVAL